MERAVSSCSLSSYITVLAFLTTTGTAVTAAERSLTPRAPVSRADPVTMWIPLWRVLTSIKRLNCAFSAGSAASQKQRVALKESLGHWVVLSFTCFSQLFLIPSQRRPGLSAGLFRNVPRPLLLNGITRRWSNLSGTSIYVINLITTQNGCTRPKQTPPADCSSAPLWSPLLSFTGTIKARKITRSRRYCTHTQF